MKHHFIRNRDIVMFSFQSWDTQIGSNFKDMAIELAKNNRVLFINRALDRSSLYKTRKQLATQTRLASIKTGEGELVSPAPNIWVHNPRVMMESINGIPFAGLHDRLNKMNGRRLAAEINKMISRLQFSEVILINDNDFIRGYYLKEMIHCSTYIFYLRDYMLGVDFFRRHGQRHETGTIRKADLVVANSEYLAAYARKNNPDSYYIGQGCDFTQFVDADLAKPADLAAIPGPIIGYTGFVSAWRIDTNIIRQVAENCPQYSIVLIGPIDWKFKTGELSDLKNVHFLGGRPPEQLVNYIAHFDVCINPQILNDVTIGNYPRKADEYLALGKPLVATATEGMKMFAPYCFLCSGAGEYADTIKEIITNPAETNNELKQQERKLFALAHTWEDSIGMLGDAYYSLETINA